MMRHLFHNGRHCAAAIFLAAETLTAAGCVAAEAKNESAPARKPLVKVGIFADNGVSGVAALKWARLLGYSPQTECTWLTGKDIRAGKLSGMDILVCPGGGSLRQCTAMGKSGVKAVREFVANGGAYLGACAGCYNTLNNEKRLQLLPFEWIPGAAGKTAPLRVDIDEHGAKVLGIPAGRYVARYAGGPIMRKSAQPGEGWGEVLGVYRSSVSDVDKAPFNFIGTPAIIHGQYGKGKVIATSFHPESWEATNPIALGCFQAVTGVKPTPKFPKKNRRPLRVGFFAPGIITPRCVSEMFELDRNPDIDLNLISTQEIDEGVLCHLDALVLPHGSATAYNKAFTPETRRKCLTAFMDDGGKVFAAGSGAKILPEHKNARKLAIGRSFAAVLPAD